QWQWNHTPHNHLWSVTERTGALRLYTGKLCQDLTQSYNTLTQRTMEDRSKAVVTIDGSAMKENDVAGISAFLGGYAAVALLLEEGCYYIAMFAREPESPEHFGEKDTVPNELLYQKVRVDSPIVTLGCVLDYEGDKEEASFYYKQGEAFIPIGIAHKMVFSLDHFMGCRFGLFYYAKEQLGGHVDFMNFCYEQSLRGGMFRVPSRTLASFVRNA
ncbi:MAG: hypothetical protein PWP24_425, partial [Clostridiales bacterium]|nr:hypothetical protein [Clostridiales bacterium]